MDGDAPFPPYEDTMMPQKGRKRTGPFGGQAYNTPSATHKNHRQNRHGQSAIRKHTSPDKNVQFLCAGLCRNTGASGRRKITRRTKWAGHDGLEQGWSIEKQHGKRIRRYAGMIPSAGLNYCSVIFLICQVKSGNPAKKRRNLPLPAAFTAGNVRFFPFPP